MLYEIIFYHSWKTAELQTMLEDGLATLGLRLAGGYASSDAVELSEKLAAAGKRRNIIFVIGGSEEGNKSPCEIIKKVITPKKSKLEEEKISSDNAECIIMTISEQSIILLPDDTEKLISLMPNIRKKLSERYGIKDETQDSTNVNSVIKELDTQMAETKRVRVSPSGSTAEKTKAETLKKLKIKIAVLLILAAAQLGAAAYLFLTN